MPLSMEKQLSELGEKLEKLHKLLEDSSLDQNRKVTSSPRGSTISIVSSNYTDETDKATQTPRRK